MTSRRITIIALGLTCLFVAGTPARSEEIAIAEIKRDDAVDFEKEVLPILRRKCLACHNRTDAESGLVLETPTSILKGGSEGPSAVAGKGLESLLVKVVAGKTEPFMPPEDNDVGAKPLSPEEIGLLKLWIDQGAKGEVTGSGPIQWQPLPRGVNPIYSVSVSPDGQYAAAGRANQIFLYHVPTKREVGRVTDPALLEEGTYDKPGVAHLDLVQSLRFSPDSELLVSGGYRTVKFWKRARNAKKVDVAGAESAVKAIAVSPDGKWAATGEENGKLKLYELPSGKLSKTLEGHAGAISGVAFSTDSAKLLSGGQDKTVRLWNVADGAAAGSIETPAPVNAVALVQENTLIASGNADNVIRVWALPQPAAEAAEGEEAAAPTPAKELKGHGGPVTSLAAVPNNAGQLLSGSQDGTVRLWDVNGAKQVRSMNHGGPVTSVAVRPDGAKLASASSNNIAKLWNAADGKQLAELRGDFRAKIRVEDATRIVALAKREIDATKGELKAANDRKTAEEKNAKTADEARTKADEELKKKVEAEKKPVADKAAADKKLADAEAAKKKGEADKKSAEARMTAADAAIKKAQADLAAADKYLAELAGANKVVNDNLAAGLNKAREAAKAAPDNKVLADLVALVDKSLKDASAAAKKKGDELKVAAQKAVTAGQTEKTAAAEAMKKAGEAIAKADGEVKAATEEVKKTGDAAKKATDEKNAAEKALQSALRTAERAKQAVKKAADAIPPAEAVVKQAEEAHAKKEGELKTITEAATASEKPYFSVAFSPDNLTLATAGEDQTVRTWDAETGVAVETYAGHGAAVTAVAYTAEKDVISFAANNTGVVWDTNPAWTLARTIGSVDSTDQFIDRVTALDISPDGKLLATGSGEPSRSGQLKLWKVEDGSFVKEIAEAHSDTIFGLEFSPDGKQIASSAADRFAKIFDIETGKFVRSFEGHTHHVLGVSWRADGRWLVTSGADNVIKVWDVKTGDQRRTISGFGKEVTSIRFVADGDIVVASSGDKTVWTKNANNGGNVKSFGGATDFMYSVDASANGKVIVAGGQDSIVRVWQDNGTVIANFEPPKQEEGAE